MLPSKLAFIDIETTGGSYFRDRVIEIGVLRVEDNQLVKTYSTLVNPETYIPEYIQSMTGINNDMVWKAPTFRQIQEELRSILEGAVFVAHNVRFDYGFVKNEFKRLGQTFSFPQLCTVRLSKALYPQYPRHNLDSLIERFNFSVANRHRAFDDAQVLWEFYQQVHEKFPLEKLVEVENHISKKITVPINLSQGEIDNLPEGPGVYIFYGEAGEPLYVGKSVNIKDRVLSHFRSDADNPKELRISQQIFSIEALETSGELGALLKEATLIKELMPLHNRALRRMNKLNVLKKINKDGLDTVFLEMIDQVEPEEMDQILGIFKTRKAAQMTLANLASEYQLCKRALGLEKGKGFCFDYHLEKCKGVCGGKEDKLLYNLRFNQAFAIERLRPWPFKGAIGIKEEDPITGEGETFVIDKWCLLGSVKYGADYQKELTKEYNFDYDSYKILAKYLANAKGDNVFEIEVKQYLEQDSPNFIDF